MGEKMRKCKICGSYTYVNANSGEIICVLKKCGWKEKMTDRKGKQK